MDVSTAGQQLNDLKTAPKLKRVLGLWDLIFYGIVLIQPISVIGLFGIASQVSKGHMVTTLLIAMTGMMLTAISYGRMASLFPSAGSAYTYVGKGLNVHLGFLAGWVMFLDYLIIPIINTVYGALTLQRLIPSVPFVIWVVLFISIVTLLNLRGIRSTARSNEILLVLMAIIISFFFVMSIRYLFNSQGWDGLLSYKPFYNPATFNFGAIMTATSFAALTYIGFDGVTTLAEEVKNPRKNLLLAPAMVCLFTGLFCGFEIYIAQQVWPDYNAFPNVETAFFDVSARVGGSLLSTSFAVVLCIGCLGTCLAGQAGAARLLYAMGRDNVLPGKFFSHVSNKSAIPNYNVILIGGLTVSISLIISYQGAAELLNFGAFLGFIGVNLAAFRQFYLLRPAGQKRNFFTDAVVPFIGFGVCFAIWISLPLPAKIVGMIWLLTGIVFLLIKTRGLKEKPIEFDYNDI
ncbi:MAG: APC family permease [Bacteroidales bacterium]|nr:APC family permease [Bacteroidales bacterium]MBK8882951.1 APC family permease [Bacteroidales bacterium]